MLTILNVTVPFFAVIGCGYLSGRLGILGQAGRAGLNGFVFYFSLPVLLFSIMANSDFGGGFEWEFPLGWALASLLLFVVTFVIGRAVFRLDAPDGTVHAMGGIYGNTGYVGIPLVVVAFGSEASVPMIVCLTIDLAIMFPLGMLLIEAARGSGEGGRLVRVFGRTLLSIVRNPLIIAIAAGTAIAVLGWELPAMVAEFTTLLGAAAAPCALFALGSSLYGQPMRAAMAEVAFVSLIKLAVHPLLVWYVMFHVFGVGALWGYAAVLAAAMPVAATVFVLAQQYDTYVVRTSTAIALSTAVSVASVTAILAWLPTGGLSTQ